MQNMVVIPMTDEQQIQQLLVAGDQQDKLFQLILDTYQERLYWHIRKMVGTHEDANDVFQNCMIKAYKGIAKFKGDSSLLTWLHRIASNESITFLNKRNKRGTLSIDDEELGISNTVQAASYTDNSLAEVYLKEALETLPVKQKEVFIMRYYDELTYQAIEEILGTSVGGLKASYHHAVKKIEAYIRKQF